MSSEPPSSAVEIADESLSLLYSSIEDMQQSIRAIDVKATILLAALTIPATQLYAALFALLPNDWSDAGTLEILAIGAGSFATLLWTLAIFFTLRAIQPRINPRDAIPSLPSTPSPFFAASLFKPRCHNILIGSLPATDRTVPMQLAAIPRSRTTVATVLVEEQLKVAALLAFKVPALDHATRASWWTLIASLVAILLKLAESV